MKQSISLQKTHKPEITFERCLTEMEGKAGREWGQQVSKAGVEAQCLRTGWLLTDGRDQSVGQRRNPGVCSMFLEQTLSGKTKPELA